MSAKDEFLSWQKRREICFERDGYKCVWCGKSEGVLHADHLYPRSKGGTDALDNLVTSCERCNLGKHARLIPDRWIPVATCYCCGIRAHPGGTAQLSEHGPLWMCATCKETHQEIDSADLRFAREEGEWSDLALEQYSWDAIEFAANPELLAEKYPHIAGKESA